MNRILEEDAVSYYRNRVANLEKNHSSWSSTRDCSTTPWTSFHTSILKANRLGLQRMLEMAKQDPRVLNLMLNSHIDYNQKWNSDYSLANIIKSDELLTSVTQKDHLSKFYDEQVEQFKTGTYELPLVVACFCKNLEIIKMLLEYGIHVIAYDSTGSSVIHSLVEISKTQPDFALEALDLILSYTDGNDLYTLVTKVNHNGNTALHKAAKKHCLEIIIKLFQINGVYRFPLFNNAGYQHILYDITMFENATAIQSNFSNLHFLYNLGLVHEYELKYYHRCQIFAKEPFVTWIWAKQALYAADLYVWFSISLLFLVMFMVQLIWYYAGEKHDVSRILCLFILITAGISVVTQCACLYTERHVYAYVARTCCSKGLPIAFKSHYIFIEVFFALTILVTESLHLSDVACNNQLLFTWLNFLAIIFGLVSILKFTQLNSSMAHFIIQFDRMLFDVMLMLAVWFLLYIIFVLVFYTLNFPLHCSYINCNQTEADFGNVYNETDAMFQTFLTAAYETFMLGLYIHAPKPLYFEQSSMPTVSMLAYSVFLLIVSLVMVNSVIALMIDKVKQLYQFKATVKHLQAIAFTMFLEGIYISFKGYLSPFRFHRVHVYNRYFIESEGKVYLHVIENNVQVGKKPASCQTCGKLS